MWFEVVIAVLVLLYIYNVGVENMKGYDIIKILIIILVPILVYNFVKGEQIERQ